MVNSLASLILAVWVSAIALLSVQNATPVTLRFLTLQTVRLPIGLLLGFSASAGMVGTAALLALSGSRQPVALDEDLED